MKRHSLPVFMLLGIAFAIANPAYAEFLNKSDAEKLLAGNTFEGKEFKFGREVTVYLDSSGSYKRLDDLNNKESGIWKIDSDGKLCLKRASKFNCRNIEPGEKEGVYLLIKNGKKSVQINKVLTGNPKNL